MEPSSSESDPLQIDLRAVRKVRPGAVETPAQQRYVLDRQWRR